MQIGFSVPIFPSANSAYYYRNGGRVLTEEARAYKQYVKIVALNEKRKQGWITPVAGVWLYMDLWFFMPNKIRRDNHNFKVMIDAMQDKSGKLLYVDDYFVMPRVQKVTIDRENPRIEILLHDSL